MKKDPVDSAKKITIVIKSILFSHTCCVESHQVLPLHLSSGTILIAKVLVEAQGVSLLSYHQQVATVTTDDAFPAMLPLKINFYSSSEC